MKKIYILLTSLLALALFGCEDHEADVYNGDGFVQFKDAEVSFPIMGSGEQVIGVTIGITKTSEKDLTFAIVADESSTAVAGVDYELIDKTVTIPAGKYTASVGIKGFYDHANPNGKLLVLKFDADASLINADYGNKTTINLYQYCDFNIDELVGTYMCTPGFPYTAGTQYEVEFVKKDATTGTFIELYEAGVNIDVVFNTSDPTNFNVKVAQQVGWLHPSYGDAFVETKGKASPFSMCNKTFTLNLFHSVSAGYFGEKSSYLEKID